VIFGWMFFGDAPRMTMMIGAALIIASGLFIFIREQTLKRRQAVLPAVSE
jgi:drug/metabolite transporter (DMT)-like permease